MAHKDQSFDIRFPVAFGSGLAAALLFVAAWQQGTVASLLLAALSPLPIMIATLGFGHGAGLGAAVAAAVTIMALIAAATTATFSLKLLISASLGGLFFALALSLPAWWLAHLAATGEAHVILPWLLRIVRFVRGSQPPPPLAEVRRPAGHRLHYPFGDMLLSIAAIAFVVVTTVILGLVLRQGSYEVGLAHAIARVEPLIVDMLGTHELPKTFDIPQFARLMVEIVMPALLSGMIALALTANLWLAGRVVELSHRLIYPWPDIPHDLRIPRFAALLFIACLGFSAVHGLGGVIARIAAAALGVLFLLQGLATVHDLSRGMKFRTTLLCGLYLALALLLPWPIIIFTIIGLLEAGFSLRERKARAATKST